MSNAPHWEQLLEDLWDRADHETFESVDVREYCRENGYSETDVALVMDVRPMWEYIECGVSPMWSWFHTPLETENE